ncbi:alpha/beta-hydrolase [Pleomassaria siparia CBS 279.74]|uniref:Alpha/beta-hydrolase n=1 Tax=Pleomassaria siparia CBS 279.74 TaxID=1314801 RepID=A0A6G1KK93_9PLEO|nr:alpha/beta-hydrolase [Pleomassaria siparia CBS 279.74]
MDHIFAIIAEETTKFNLGDEEIWRDMYEPFYGEQPRDITVIRDQRYGPAERNLLDVFVPVNNPERGKPVLMFVHGGGFFSGDKRWSEKCWANVGHFFAQQGIIVVIVTHQLVTFDMNGGDDSPKSDVQYPAGANDMQLARQWIYDNIAAERFGRGSVDKVLLFGHSSGGAHIAMNLYGSPRKVFPPVAGVMYLSVPFWYDRTRPIRQRILQIYYGSDAEEIWGPRSAIGLFQRLPDDSPWLKEACDAAVAFFNAYRARSSPAGTLPIMHVIDKHNHLSNVLSIGTSDTAQATKLLEFIRSCTTSQSTSSSKLSVSHTWSAHRD